MIGAWRARAPSTRWIVLDLETSGLDPSSDRVLSIAAMALRFRDGAWRMDYADSFECLFKQVVPPSKANILIHGLGERMLQSGLEPLEALARFEAFRDGAPLLAFHAAFDEAMLKRAYKRFLGTGVKADWLDIAAVAQGLYPEQSDKSLEAWLARFNLEVVLRHRAASDVIASAELFLALLPRAQTLAPDRALRFTHLKRIGRAARWLG